MERKKGGWERALGEGGVRVGVRKGRRKGRARVVFTWSTRCIRRGLCVFGPSAAGEGGGEGEEGK